VDRTLLPDRNEPDTEGECDTCSEYEASSLDRGHLGDSLTLERFGKSPDRAGKELSVCEKPEDVGVAVDPAKAREEILPERHGQDSAGSAALDPVAAALPRRSDDRLV
jgi:hypothetical protein